MNEFNTYEFVVAQKSEGKARLTRILAIVAYVLVFLIAFVVLCVSNLMQFVAVLVMVYIPLVVFTWRFFSVEFEYSMTSGIMTFSHIYGGKSRKEKLSVTIKDMKEIAPYTEEARVHLETLGLKQNHLFVSSLSAPDMYYAVFEANGEMQVVYFEATQKALQILRFYNTSTVVSTVSR